VPFAVTLPSAQPQSFAAARRGAEPFTSYRSRAPPSLHA
jgi:hypothetical protein